MRDFFKYTLATFVGLILFVTLGLGGLIFLVAAIATAAGDTQPAVEDQSILALDLSLNITDSEPETQVLGSVLSGGIDTSTVSLRSVLSAIAAAAKDDRIVGLYLYGEAAEGGVGLASLREVRQALEAFRAAGKPIYAYETAGSERDYYLTSVADTLMLNPSGVLEINGFQAQTTFYAGAFEKYGIGVQVLRVGRYKSAVEPFTRTSSSPEARQQTQQLLADLWGEFLSATAKSRDLTPQQLQAIADSRGIILADQAKQSGLVDQVAYEDEVAAALRKLTGEAPEAGSESFRQVSVPDYAEAIAADAQTSDNKIAVVYAEGDIVDGDGGTGQIGGDRLAAEIRDLREDDDVKAIVLRINSPGGSATASDLVAREVQLTTEDKPVIVSMGNLAASGGYMIATQGDQIFASPNTITGSIGVFGLLPNVQGLANNNGITWDVTKTGRYADSQTITRPKTPEELAIGQSVVNQIYDRFVGSVAESRGLDRARVNEIAQGRVWSGIEAQKIGLVDHLGGLEDALKAAAEQAKLGDDWQIEEYPKTRSLEERIFGSLLNSHLGQLFFRAASHDAAPATDPLSIEVQSLQTDLETLRAMNDPMGAYARLPFNPRID